MKYEDRIICFIDILGFSEIIRQTVTPAGVDDEIKIAVIADAINLIRDVLDIDRPEKRKDKTVTQFSDSIVISFPTNETSGVFYSILEILWVQMGLLQKGIVCRGAMTRGKVIHTPRLLFGPAMVEVYNLESKAALYPRVILGQAILDVGALSHASHNRPEDEVESILGLLARDTDDMYYIDYIEGAQSELNDPVLDYPIYLRNLQSVIAKGLDARDVTVKIKYQWMRSRFQSHLKKIKAGLAESGLDDDVIAIYNAIPDINI